MSHAGHTVPAPEGFVPHVVAHHFESQEQEYQSAKLGFWLFLCTEILLFGGLFAAFFYYKSMYQDDFVRGGDLLAWKAGTLNTVILLVSSYTKTKKLKAFAQVMVEDYEGDDANLFALDLPELRTRLLSIYGIGEETADDIILYAAKKPSFVMDTYTRRLVDRLGWGVDKNNYSDYQRLFESHLEPDVEMWGDLHAQLDGHAARVCRKLNPKCNECVLLDLCSTGQTNTG